MKKTVRFLLFAFLALAVFAFLVSCGDIKKDEQNTEETVDESKGTPFYVYDKETIKTESGWLYKISREYDEIGNVTKEITEFNGMGGVSEYTKIYKYSYGEKLKLIKTVWTSDNITETTFFSFDEYGYSILELVESSVEDLTVTTHTYDEEGRKIKSISYKEDSPNDITEFLYYYNEKGYLVKRIEKKEYLGVEMSVEYTYDDKGRLIRETCPDAFSKDSNIVYKYNDKDVLIESVYTHSFGVTVSKYEYEGEHIFYK